VRKNYKIFLPVFFISFLLDQISKFLVVKFLSEKSSIHIFRYFSLTYVKNKGLLFGIFGNFDIALPIIMCGFFAFAGILFYILKNPKIPSFYLYALGLVEGGIAGNLADRLRIGAVIDFINFHIWPVFNLADAFIVVGVISIIFTQLRGKNASCMFQNR